MSMDLSFIQRPHHWTPRRNYSATGSDWQMRVDYDSLRKNRLQRAKDMMEKHDIDALVMFVGENVRYTCSVYQGNWKNNIFIRYAILPRGGEPIQLSYRLVTLSVGHVVTESTQPFERDAREGEREPLEQSKEAADDMIDQCIFQPLFR